MIKQLRDLVAYDNSIDVVTKVTLLAAADALQAQATKITALRAFHSFFLDKGESLFASFGMDAIDLFNAAATEQE